ncbi:MAG TPA: hypothetical protein VFI02_20540 [Armatimonadota bacterium]|nr:hypothetical protein [Armatimonadota bacterium]
MNKPRQWPRIRMTRRVYKGETHVSYCIDSGIIDGKRRQEFRQTPHEAEVRAAEIRKEHEKLGDLAFALTAEQRIEAAKAFRALEGHGTLAQAVEAFLGSRMNVRRLMTVAQVQESLYNQQVADKLRPASLQATRTRIKAFLDCYGDVSIATIYRAVIEAWLATRTDSAASKAAVLRYLNVLFNHAKELDVITENPVEKIRRPKVEARVPEILTVDKVEALLRVAEKKLPAVAVAGLAIRFFAGIRSEEMKRLTPDCISLANRQITIRPDVSKIGAQRHVSISANLLEWLETYPTAPGEMLYNDLSACREEVGLNPWPNNATRHCFASYHLAMHQDAGRTAFELGHTGDAKLLYKHYRNPNITSVEAERYWKITPNAPQQGRRSRTLPADVGTELEEA